jgi:hypothetical protein
MHNFVIELMRLGAPLPREKLLRIADIAPLVDRITDATMADAIHQGADQRSAQAMEWLRDVHFVNLIISVGTVYQFKSIPCSEALRENRNSVIRDHYEPFSDLMVIVDSFGMVLCSIAVDNLPVQVSGMERALQMNGSLAIHVKCFAQMANLV